MTSSVTLSAAVRSNLLALDQTSALQAPTQQRLATGKKVNSALDNPTNYFTAAALSARAGELTNRLDSMTNGVNTLTAADNGLTSIQATVTQARQDASWQSTSYSLDATSIGTTQLKNLTFAAGAVGTTPVTVALNTLGTGTATTSSAGAQFSAIPGLTSPVTATSNVFSGAVILASTPAQFSFSDADIAAMADNTTFSMQRSDGPFFATATKVASSPNSSADFAFFACS